MCFVLCVHICVCGCSLMHFFVVMDHCSREKCHSIVPKSETAASIFAKISKDALRISSSDDVTQSFSISHRQLTFIW